MAAFSACSSAPRLQPAPAVSRRAAFVAGPQSSTLKLRAAGAARIAAGSARPSTRRAAVAAQAQAGPSTKAAAGAIPVSVVVPECRLSFGEGLKLVGSCPQLGDWDLAAAAQLEWHEGDNWVASVELPPGQYSFKLVITKPDGGAYWEEGDNRTMSVAQQPAGTPVSCTCRFGDTRATEQVAGAAEIAPVALKVSPAKGAASPAPAAASSPSPPAAAASGAGAGAGAGKPSAAAAMRAAAAAASTAPPTGRSASPAARKMAADAVKSAGLQAGTGSDAEQLQAAVEAAAKRIADLDKRKEALAAKLDNLQNEMENKLDIRPRSPSPPPLRRRAQSPTAPADRPAARNYAAAMNGSAASSTSRSASPAPRSRSPSPSRTPPQTGWLFKSQDADLPASVVAASSSSSSEPTSAYSRAILPFLLLPILLPLSIGAYIAFTAAFPELGLPPFPLKDVQTYSQQLGASVANSLTALQKASTSGLVAAQKASADSVASLKAAAEQQLPAMQAAAGQAASSLQEASKGAVGAMSDAAGQASKAAAQASQAASQAAAQASKAAADAAGQASQSMAAAADAASKIQLPDVPLPTSK